MTAIGYDGSRTTIRPGAALCGERWRAVEVTTADLAYDGFAVWFTEFVLTRLGPTE